MCLDAVFGAVNAIQEMLFCWQKEALSILPALPKRLDHGSVRGLVFPEGTLDIEWTLEGKVTVTVRATRDLDTGILLRGEMKGRVTLAAGQTETLTF
jgi:alpha-L-fucosidase 2